MNQLRGRILQPQQPASVPPARSGRSRLLWCLLLGTLVAGGALGCSGEARRVAAPTAPPARPDVVGAGVLVSRRERIVRPLADGSEQVLKEAPPAVMYSHPRWSPDGRHIAYVVTTYGTATTSQDAGTAVVVSAPDGSAERTVLRRPGPQQRIEGLAWTADGQALLLSTLDQLLAGSLQIERLELASGTSTILIEGGAYPAAAPDGSRIAYLTYSSGVESPGLWTARPDGSDRRLLVPLTDAIAGVRPPRFSPDSTRIAFGAVERAQAALMAPECLNGRRWPWPPRAAAAHGPPVSIWVIPAAGGPLSSVGALQEDDPSVAWSPDGTRLLVLGGCGLHLLDPVTGASQRVGQGAALGQLDWR